MVARPDDSTDEAKPRGAEAALELLDAQVAKAWAAARQEQWKARCWEALRALIYVAAIWLAVDAVTLPFE